VRPDSSISRSGAHSGIRGNDARPAPNLDMTDLHPKFSSWRDRVAQTRVLVAGDVMLDRYWFGDVERI